MPTIEVTVSPHGDTTIATQGFAGNRCQQATRTLEAALGVVQLEQLTAEYHIPSTDETVCTLESSPTSTT